MTQTEVSHKMTATERDLQLKAVGDQRVLLTLRTDTRIDTGKWWRKSRLWLTITEDHLILFAASRRGYAQAVPVAQCQQSHYCPTAGGLLLEPRETWRFNPVAVAPTQAVEVLRHLQSDPKPSHQPQPELTQSA